MCICDGLQRTAFNFGEVEKLVQYEGMHCPAVMRRESIDGKDIMLVQAVNSCGSKTHLVLCPADFDYRIEARMLHGGGEEDVRIVHDTYKCPRKE